MEYEVLSYLLENTVYVYIWVYEDNVYYVLIGEPDRQQTAI